MNGSIRDSNSYGKESSSMRSSAPYLWSNPHKVDLDRPYIYLIEVQSGTKEYKYVGIGAGRSRMDRYLRNVSKILAGKPKGPLVKPDGTPQRKGNLYYRYVHLVLATAVRKGWKIEHFPIENCEKSDTVLERRRMEEHECNMNDGPSWPVEAFDLLSAKIE
jgi:hypothetical protein